MVNKIKIYTLSKKILPKKAINLAKFLFEKNLTIRSFIKVQLYKFKHSEIKLLFGYDGNKKGFLTLGTARQNDIVFKKNLRLFLKDNSVSEIQVINFLNSLNSAKEIKIFLQECLRVLKPQTQIIIKFINADLLLEKYFKNKKYFLQEKFWYIKDRDLFNTEIDAVNSILFDDLKTKKLITVSNLTHFLKHFNFEILETKNNPDKLYSTIIAQKKTPELFSKIATKLPAEKEIKNDIPIYLYNCDPLWILENFKNINLNKIQNRNFATVTGSLYFINLIPYLKPKNLYLFDINDYQTRYIKLFIEIIKESQNFENFLEFFFLRKYEPNIEQFLSNKFDQKIYQKIYNLTADKEIFQASLAKIALAKYEKVENCIPALKIAGNSMCQYITLLDKELFKPGPEMNVIYTFNGLAKNFEEIKKLLLQATIKTAALESKDIYDFIKDNGIIYISNIGGEDALRDPFTELPIETLKSQAKDSGLVKAFAKQWIDSSVGFNKFLKNINHNFWIIDSVGNLFNSQILLKYKSDSHEWLWQKIKPQIFGNTIELIHLEDNKWGFKEHLETININRYIKKHSNTAFDTIIFHILLANKLPIDTFRQALKIAAENSKKIIILEHDKDSINFDELNNPYLMDIRTMLNILRSIDNLENADIKVSWGGASAKIDEELHGNKANLNRNFIITINL